MKHKTRILRNISHGVRGICPTAKGEEVSIDTDPGEVIEVQLTDKELEDAIKTGWFEQLKSKPDQAPDAAQGSKSPGGDVSPDTIRGAILSLDPDEDAHWTSDGQPAVEAVSAMAGKRVTRADIVAAAPDAKRS